MLWIFPRLKFEIHDAEKKRSVACLTLNLRRTAEMWISNITIGLICIKTVGKTATTFIKSSSKIHVEGSDFRCEFRTVFPCWNIQNRHVNITSHRTAFLGHKSTLRGSPGIKRTWLLSSKIIPHLSRDVQWGRWLMRHPQQPHRMSSNTLPNPSCLPTPWISQGFLGSKDRLSGGELWWCSEPWWAFRSIIEFWGIHSECLNRKWWAMI